MSPRKNGTPKMPGPRSKAVRNLRDYQRALPGNLKNKHIALAAKKCGLIGWNSAMEIMNAFYPKTSFPWAEDYYEWRTPKWAVESYLNGWISKFKMLSIPEERILVRSKGELVYFTPVPKK